MSEREGSKSSQQPAWFNYTNSQEFMERVRFGNAATHHLSWPATAVFKAKKPVRSSLKRRTR